MNNTLSAATLWKNLRDGFGARLRAGLATRPRSLTLRESLSLGERRFVAVVECDGQRFLVGGGSQNVQLIATLNPLETRATEASE
jgi:flagellar biogenesis protein FliO